MPVYSKVLVPYDYKKEYKISNNTSWAYTGSFWLRASGENLVDKSNSNLPLTSTGTGNFDNVHGPSVRFPFKGLNFNTKYYNIPISYKMTASLSIVFSGWVYLDADPNTNNSGQPIISNGISSGAQDGYSIFIDTEGRLNVRLAEAAPSNATDTNCQVLDRRTVVGHFKQSKKWHHFAVVIAPHSAVGDYQANVSIYYNGNKVTTQNGLTGANPTYNSTNIGIDIGYGYAEDFDSGESKIYLNGTLADIAMFKFDSTVTDAQMETLYNSSKNGVNQLQSGFLNVSLRRMIRDLDSRDSHPTISRNSLDGRLGNHSIFFDDSNASDPAPSSQVNFPSALPEESALLTTINSPFKNGELRTTVGNVSFDSHNMFHDRNDQPAYQPFIESKVYIENNSAFYQTGTLESIIPGFSGSLRSKEIVVIELENNSELALGTRTSNSSVGITAAAAGDTRIDYMAYWNNSSNSFDTLPGFYIHDGSSSTINKENRENFGGNLTGSCVAFSNPRILFSSSYEGYTDGGAALDTTKISIHKLQDSFYKSIGQPISDYGFPDDDRYDAIDNSLIDLSNYINKPFLLEKIEFDFSNVIFYNGSAQAPTFISPFSYYKQSLTQHHYSNVGPLNRIHTLDCFLLRQYNQRHSSTYNSLWVSNNSGNGFYTQSINSNQNRDVVVYGNSITARATSTAAFKSTDNITDFKEFIKTNSNYNIIPEEFSTSTGELSTAVNIKTSPKILYKNSYSGFRIEGSPPTDLATSNSSVHIHKWDGGPSNISNINSGRLLGAAVSGNGSLEGTASNLATNEVIISAGDSINIETKSIIPSTGSVYVLDPKDKLIFGIQKLLSWGENGGYSGNPLGDHELKIEAGSQIKITMFGSYVQNEKPIQNSLNQNLNNHVVHESIGAEPVLDQFDTEYLGAFTGSFVDDNYSGTSTGPLYGTTTATDNIGGFLDRKLESRTTEGTQGISGSLKRTMRLVSDVDRIYDSIMPSIGDILDADEAAGYPSNASNLRDYGYIIYGNKSGGWNNKSYFFPFESRYENITRTDDVVYNGQTISSKYITSLECADSSIPGPSYIGYGPGSGTVRALVRLANRFGTSKVSARGALIDSWWYTGIYEPNSNEFKSLLYGIGDGYRGVFAFHNEEQTNDTSKPVFTTIRGYKYGVYNTSPAYRSLVFRRDSYGQLRDMLEQSIYTTSFTRIQLGGIGPQITTLERPIDVRFVTQAGIPQANRSNTSCSNLSTYATSSVPFFDRDNDNIMNLDTNGNSSGQVNRGEISIQTIDIDRNFQVGVGPFESI